MRARNVSAEPTRLLKRRLRSTWARERGLWALSWGCTVLLGWCFPTFRRWQRGMPEENIEQYGLTDKASVRQGDLFETVPETFDCIIFNHPFFCGVPPEGDTVAASMLAPEDLIHRFLEQAPSHLRSGGVIVMPFYTKAGTANDPAVQGPKHGFNVTTCFRAMSNSGLQTGEILIHELRRI